MNRNDFASQTATGGLLRDDRQILRMCFDEEGKIKDEFAEICLQQLQMQTIIRINSLNKLISESIHELGFMGQWTTLSQIFRSLPDCVFDAAAKEPVFKDEMQEWAKEMNEFIGLGSLQRKRALELIKDEEADTKN